MGDPIRDLDDPATFGSDPAPSLPTRVRVAAMIWIVAGTGFLLIALWLGWQCWRAKGADPTAAGALYLFLTLIPIAILFGGLLLGAGIRTIRGTPRDVLGSSIMSMIVGLLTLPLGAFCLAAGVIALSGRGAYRAWRAPGACRVCGHERRDTAGTRCPECGIEYATRD